MDVLQPTHHGHSSRSDLWKSCQDTVKTNWHLGLSAFGGPPVHFQIFHKKFVEDSKWIDEQIYQELFGISQALPGPASTKMLFCINSIHGGFSAGFLSFLLWCLPGALGMYGLSLGVSRVGDTLPGPVYALLSGLNAATVGIIALAAVQLAEKAITDKLTRALVFFGGAAGMLYSALWYFPVLMVAAGLVTVVWDFRWLHRAGRRAMEKAGLRSPARERVESQVEAQGTEVQGVHSVAIREIPEAHLQVRRTVGRAESSASSLQTAHEVSLSSPSEDVARTTPSSIQISLLTWKLGALIITLFLASFVTILTLRSVLRTPPLIVSLFANLYLAGTIIFGGGPVVIPLLREYIVQPGWVSARDFLLGLAIIQSFPGPNFNFAVYLGSLAVKHTAVPSFVGALVGFVGIFAPGIVIVTGVMGFWSKVRGKRWLISGLRGVNAAAVGIVYTAVYRLWQIGFVDEGHTSGSALGAEPWLVVVSATAFVGGRWFGLNAPGAIVLSGVMGLVWYAVARV